MGEAVPDWWFTVMGVVLGVALSVGAFSVVLIMRRRRNPMRALDRAARRARKDCRNGYHEWATPWRYVQTTCTYAHGRAPENTLPTDITKVYETTCRQCGEPASKGIQL